ncbi:MAG: hypothetical protein ACEPOZ_15735 [Marinifilaceae bacterium]
MQSKLIKLTFLFLLVSCSFLAYSCQNTQKKTTKDQLKTQKITGDRGSKQVKSIFYNIPSPIVVTNIIETMNLAYNPDLLNPVSNAENYLSQADLSLNLGVYGADLSYIRIYEQFQDAARYLAIIKKFTRELGIPEEQEKKTAQRIESNIENRDSLVQIITETFTNSDSYLKENQRGGTASLIIFGGWVETLYLATNIQELNQSKKELIDLIVQQKHSVKNLVKLLNQYPDEPKIAKLLPDLRELENKFNQIKSKRSPNTKVEKQKGKTFIRNKVTHQIPSSLLLEIKELNDRLRGKLIQL